jgi:hypothetical protein
MLGKLKYLCLAFLSLGFGLCAVSHLGVTNQSIRVEKALKGTWLWINDRDTLSIKLTYKDTIVSSKVNTDTFRYKISGWHRYIENGSVMESTFSDLPNQEKIAPSIFGTIMNNEKALLWFRDITRARNFRVEIEFLDSTCTLMKWTTNRPQERVLYPPPKPKIWEGQTIPSPIILHKISDE